MALSGFFFDTQNPNPNPSPSPNVERQMQDVLCILSSDGVFVIDMDSVLMDEDYKKGSSLKRLPVKRTLDLLNSGMPLGMSLAKWRNSLYLFGGYKPSQSATLGLNPLSWRFMLREEDLPDLPCHAYTLDLTDDQSEPVPLSSMAAPKLYPIVEVIEDKIYVLSMLMLSPELPVFEVFYPETGKWRTLPPPLPPWKYWQVHHNSVCGSVITCKVCPMHGRDSFFCRFNTSTEQWEYLEDITTRELLCMQARPALPNEDVYCTFGEDDEFWAMGERGWPEGNDGYSTRFEPSDLYPLLGASFFRSGDITMADTSDQGEYHRGLVQYNYDDDKALRYPIVLALHIIVFIVEKQESAPLSIRYLRRQVYEFKIEDDQQPCFAIKKAVVGRLSYNTLTGTNECFREEQGGRENN